MEEPVKPEQSIDVDSDFSDLFNQTDQWTDQQNAPSITREMTHIIPIDVWVYPLSEEVVKTLPTTISSRNYQIRFHWKKEQAKDVSRTETTDIRIEYPLEANECIVNGIYKQSRTSFLLGPDVSPINIVKKYPLMLSADVRRIYASEIEPMESFIRDATQANRIDLCQILVLFRYEVEKMSFVEITDCLRHHTILYVIDDAGSRSTHSSVLGIPELRDVFIYRIAKEESHLFVKIISHTKQLLEQYVKTFEQRKQVYASVSANHSLVQDCIRLYTHSSRLETLRRSTSYADRLVCRFVNHWKLYELLDLIQGVVRREWDVLFYSFVHPKEMPLWFHALDMYMTNVYIERMEDIERIRQGFLALVVVPDTWATDTHGALWLRLIQGRVSKDSWVVSYPSLRFL